MSKAHFYDLDKEWEGFAVHARKGCETARVPFMAPGRKDPLAVTAALSGTGGFGKTTLAAPLCHDEDIIQSFDDGIL